MRTTRKNTRGDVREASGSFHTFSKSAHETWTRIGSAGPESGPSGILRVKIPGFIVHQLNLENANLEASDDEVVKFIFL